MTPDRFCRTPFALTRLEDRWNPATFVVNDGTWDPTEPGSLPWCISQANLTPGQDEITFDYSATGLGTDTPLLKSLGMREVQEGVLIRGGGGGQYVTITGETPLNFTHGKADPTNALTAESVIHGMVFDNCRPAPAEVNTAKGGAIRVTGGQVRTINTRFTNNSANNGGAAFVDQGATLVLDGDQSAPPNAAEYPEQLPVNGKSRTLFQHNTSGTDGGAVESDGTVILKRVTFYHNGAGNRGGAINNNSNIASITVPAAPPDPNGNSDQSAFTDVSFRLNNAQQGGAVMFRGTNTSSLIGVKAFWNYATADGGAFCVLGGTVNVKGSIIQENAALNGAAVYLLGEDEDTVTTVDLKNVTFGGKGVLPGGTAEIDVSTFGVLNTHGCTLNGDLIAATVAAGQVVAGVHNPDPNNPNTP